ncbi:hypothetical protein HRbin02_00435 [Candidatus Calditenuaceae archaeon HR02]|nr:hypothetical protein HRbin02_00435 [Candidatus Calditenuaceae archaeon HR02]
MLVRVALIQMRMSDDIGKKAAKAGANIACLPELFTTTYFPRGMRGWGG